MSMADSRKENRGAPCHEVERLRARVAELEQELHALRQLDELQRGERHDPPEPLAISAAELEETLEITDDGFFWLDESFIVTRFNAAAERCLGRTRDEVIGRNLFDAFPEARGSIFEEQYTRALRDKTPLRFETYFGIKPYANWYDVRVYPISGGLSVFFKVTTQFRLAAAQQSRLLAILDATPDFVGIADLQGKVVYLNSSGRSMLGYQDDEDLIGTDIGVLHPPWAVEEVRERGIPTALQEGTWQGETALQAKSGRQIPVSQVIVSHRDEMGDPVFISTIARDMTEPVRSAKELREREQLLENTFESMSDGVLVLDTEFHYRYWNRAMEKISHVSRDKLIGKGVRPWDVFPHLVDRGLDDLTGCGKTPCIACNSMIHA